MKNILIVLILISLVPFNAQAESLEQELYDCISYSPDGNLPVVVKLEKAKQLIASGANLNWFNPKYKRTIIQHYLETGIGIDAPATYEKRVKLVKLYFDKGGKIKPDDHFNFYWPVAYNHAEIVEILIKNGVSAISWDNNKVGVNYSPIALAESRGNSATIEVLTKYGAKKSNSTDVIQNKFVEIAKFGSLEELKNSRVAGADVNSLSSDGKIALINVLELPIPNLETYKKFQYLINQGADVNVKADGLSFETTPLHAAIALSEVYISSGDSEYGLDIINTIISKTDNLEAEDGLGYTPLQRAVASGYPNCTNILLKAGTNTKVRNSENKTLMDLAKNQETRDVLSAFGVSGTATIESFEFRGHRFGDPPTSSMGKFDKSIVALYDRNEKNRIGDIKISVIFYDFSENELFQIMIQYEDLNSSMFTKKLAKSIIDKYNLDFKVEDLTPYSDRVRFSHKENGIDYSFSCGADLYSKDNQVCHITFSQKNKRDEVVLERRKRRKQKNINDALKIKSDL